MSTRHRPTVYPSLTEKGMPGYAAACHPCGWVGPDREARHLAAADRIAHRTEHELVGAVQPPLFDLTEEVA